MKNFLLGILAATIGGILIYAAQYYFDRHFRSPRASIEHVTYSPALVFGRREAATWLSSRERDAVDSELGRVKITLVSIENTGDEALSNQEVRIQPRDEFGGGIIAFHNHIVPGGDPSATTARITDRSLVIRYSLFNPQEMHMLWVITDSFTDFDVISRRPGLVVNGWRRGVAFEEDSSMSEVWFFTYAVIGILLFVLGVILSDRFIGSELRKRGMDLKEIMKRPAVPDGGDHI